MENYKIQEFDKNLIKVLSQLTILNQNKVTKKIKNPYLKSLWNKIYNSEQFINLYNDFIQKKINKNYIFNSYEELMCAKLLVKILNIKTKIKLNYVNFFIKKINFYFFLIGCVIKIILPNNKKKIETILYSENKKNLSNLKILKILNLGKKNHFDKFDFFKYSSIISFIKYILKNKLNIKYIKLNKILIKYLIYSEASKKINLKKLFIIEGDSPDHNLLNIISKENESLSYCFQWGCFVDNYVKYGLRNNNYNYILVWGIFYKKYLSKFNKESKIIVVGNPFINKIKIGNKILIVDQPRLKLLADNRYEAYTKLILEVYTKYKNKCLLRFHPFSKISNINLKINTHEPNKFTIIESMHNSFCGITLNSGAIVEMSRLGIIPIIINQKKTKFEKNIEYLKNINKSCLIFEEPYSALDFINKIFNNKNLRKRISKILIKKFTENIAFIGKISQRKINNIIKV